MDRRTLFVDFPLDAGLEFTGERYIPGIRGQLQYEHFHRYLAAAPYTSGKRVLDIACGEGYGSFGLAQVAGSVCGVDISEKTIIYARERYERPNLEFIAGSISAIPCETASFDVVVCFETIEHVFEQQAAMAELRRVLRPEGLLIISSPNSSAEDGALHEGNAFHERELTLEEFRDLLAPHFAHIRFAEQRFLHGSLLAEMGSFSETDERARFQSEDGATYSARRGDIGQSYFVAIASNQPAPSLGLTILDAERDFKALESQFRDAVHFANRVEMEMSEKDQILSDAQTELAQTRLAIKKLKSWRQLAEIQLAHLRLRAKSNT